MKSVCVALTFAPPIRVWTSTTRPTKAGRGHSTHTGAKTSRSISMNPRRKKCSHTSTRLVGCWKDTLKHFMLVSYQTNLLDHESKCLLCCLVVNIILLTGIECYTLSSNSLTPSLQRSSGSSQVHHPVVRWWILPSWWYSPLLGWPHWSEALSVSTDTKFCHLCCMGFCKKMLYQLLALERPYTYVGCWKTLTTQWWVIMIDLSMAWWHSFLLTWRWATDWI